VLLTAYSVFGCLYIGDAQPAHESAPQQQPTSVPEPQPGPSSSGEPADLPLPDETTDVQWTDDVVKLLIDTLVAFQPQLDQPRCKKTKVWQKIAESMNKVNPRQQLTGADVDRKWRNLIQTFRKIKDQKKTKLVAGGCTGNSTRQWKMPLKIKHQ